MALDVAEGADILLVKPALPGLDLIAAARARFDLPIAAYQVSGEYAMLMAAAERGWLDGRRAMTESITAIVRAGAGIVITYAAGDLAGWLRQGGERRMSADEQIYIQALALGLDPAWRRRTDADRADDARQLAEAEAAADGDGVRSITYSSIGIEPGVDILLWRMAPVSRRPRGGRGPAAAHRPRPLADRRATRSSGGSGHPSTSARPPSRSSRSSMASVRATWSCTHSRRARIGTSSRRNRARA